MRPKANILIVDDRPEKLLALEAVLEDLGQTIVRANSGREALRRVLAMEFAVILLDVNMPDMDGFETASMIRQRRSSRDTPIIFVTAFGDEMHASRGYSLGAVDYILAPVLPEVLRTKVAVFVDLYAKTEQLRRQAESLRARAAQLQKLAAASVAINGALSVEAMLRTIADAARDVVGCRQAITLFVLRPATALRPAKTLSFTSFSDRYAAWRGRELQLDAIAATQVAGCRTATRLTEGELRGHADWDIMRNADIPPVRGGLLAAPLCGRDGTSLGVVYLCERDEGDFSDDDEAILVQLAQMGSIALENSLYAEEREANRVKDEFLATLSHELRTPLNAILGWTQLLRMDAGGEEPERAPPPLADPAEVAHGLEVIERNARSQTKLIEDLLDVSRITTGKMRLNVRLVPLAAVARAAADAARPGLASRDIAMDVSVDPAAEDLRIRGDPDRLQQVFGNLLSNALKFTPDGGRIACRVGREGDGSARVRIADSGAGIDPKFLPFVFDRFRQADSTSTRQHGGLGIGLTVVRHIVELHGGSVSAQSEGEGRGATFLVTLPVAPADAEANNGHRAPAAPDAGASPAAPIGMILTGIRVLIVDDEPDAREVLGQILQRAGARVLDAGSAADGLAVLRRERPDAVVTDIAMPDEDGYAFLRAVRALPPAAGGVTPAIALTAYAREEDRQRSLAAGFQVHVAKPVDPAELARTLVELTSFAAK